MCSCSSPPALLNLPLTCCSGVGYAIVQRLAHEFLTTRPASHRLTLIITTRTAAKATATLTQLSKALRKSDPDAFSRLTLSSALVDLASIPSVVALAAHLAGTYPQLDALVLNAGMGAFTGINWPQAVWHILTDFPRSVTYPEYKLQAKGRLTPDGLGEVFTANVFGHYYLAHELMPLLRNGAGRVLWSGSLEAYEWTFDADDLQSLRASHSYEASKRLIDVLALSSGHPAARSWYAPDDKPAGDQDNRVRCYLAHPGICATSIVPLPLVLWWCMAAAMYLARLVGTGWHPLSCWKGAKPSVWLALASEDELRTHNAANIKWGAGSDRWGTEKLRETDVEGLGGERWDAVAAQSWQSMEALRKEWKAKMQAEGTAKAKDLKE